MIEELYHRTEALSTEKVEVDVINHLAAMAAGIEDQSVAIVTDAQLFS